jgi:hypothetical protein
VREREREREGGRERERKITEDTVLKAGRTHTLIFGTAMQSFIIT